MDTNAITKPERPLNSASNLHRRMLCPGSAWAEFGLSEAESADAQEGTLLHHHDAHPELSRAGLSDEQRRVLERNASLREKFLRGIRFDHDVRDADPVGEFVEERLVLADQDSFIWEHPVTEEPFSGHPDRVVWYPKQEVAVVFDSKFGRNPVPTAALNMQLRAYAVMAWEKLGPQQVYVAITQPWAGTDFHSARYESDDLSKSKNQILDILAQTILIKAPRRPSPQACEYCRAKAYCQPALAAATQLAVVKVLQLPVPQLEAMAPGIKLAKDVCEAWTTRMKEIARTDPDALQFHALGKEGFTTTITQPREAFQKLWAAGYLGDDQKRAFDGFVACMGIGLEKLRELVAGHNQVSAEDAAMIVEQTLESVIVKKPRERSLVKKKA